MADGTVARRGLGPLPTETVGFTVLRPLGDGRNRQYSEVEFTRGWAGADQFFRALLACGFVTALPPDREAYALLDAIDGAGEVIATYDLATRQAFAFVYRKLRLRVTFTDGDPLPPRQESDRADA
jgi:hypothetical protein